MSNPPNRHESVCLGAHHCTYSRACHLPPRQPPQCNGRHELPKCTSRGCNNALTGNRAHCTGNNTLFCADSMQFPLGLQELIITIPHVSTDRASSTIIFRILDAKAWTMQANWCYRAHSNALVIVLGMWGPVTAKETRYHWSPHSAHAETCQYTPGTRPTHASTHG